MVQHCRQCDITFEILDHDLLFYDKVSPIVNGKKYLIPPPTLCTWCRMIRRLSYRSERFLYHRKCDLTGREIISTYSPHKPFPVYNMDDWWSDKWDPLNYGRGFDFSRPFFDQFFELRNQVPRLALIQQKPMENSEYCNAASLNKNCYLVFSTNRCEDCYYGSWVNKSKNCIDNLNINNCELCYDCVGCRDCYHLKYSIDSSNCRHSAFLKNCTGCTDCFGCSNLVNKQYYIFNKPYSKQEYEKYMGQIQMSSYQVIRKMKEKFDELVEQLVVKEQQNINCENSTGNYLRNCKNADMSFECDNSEDIRSCYCLEGVKNSMDYSYWGVNAEMIYESQACGYDVYNLRFCNLCWTSCSDLFYCDHTHTTKNSFGCVGLRNKQYCILNKQYSKEEYEQLVPKIIQHMIKTKEWGEFFPMSESLYGYNETLAYEQMPLSKEEILSRGWIYQEPIHDHFNGERNDHLPDRIKDIGDDILDQVLVCEKSGKRYKIIPQELAYYRANKIPIPRLCPDERHWERLRSRLPRKIWERHCQKCDISIETSYSPDRPELVYCEECYRKEVYS